MEDYAEIRQQCINEFAEILKKLLFQNIGKGSFSISTEELMEIYRSAILKDNRPLRFSSLNSLILQPAIKIIRTHEELAALKSYNVRKGSDPKVVSVVFKW